MTAERNRVPAWPLANRPRDRNCDGAELAFKPFGFIGSLPRSIRVSDASGRSCMYAASYTRIVEPMTDGRCLMYTTLEHAPDLMPQVIEVRDAAGNVSRYDAQDPQWAID